MRSILCFVLAAGGLVVWGSLGDRIVYAEHDCIEPFVRGDANRDGDVNVADALLTLNYLFAGTGPLLCTAAADSNDNGSVEIGDAMATLTFLFAGGARLPAPYPEEGCDPSPDALFCFTEAEDVGPATPLTRSDLETIENGGEVLTGTFDDGAIRVPPETLAALLNLDINDSIHDLAEQPEHKDSIQEIIAILPPANGPAALPDELTVPVKQGECHRIDPEQLRGESYDTGFDPTPVTELRISVEPAQVCGVGTHLVEVTVTDAEGLSSTATTRVTLCEEGTDGCHVAQLGRVSAGCKPQKCTWVTSFGKFPTEEEDSFKAVRYDPQGRVTSTEHSPPVVLDGSPTAFRRRTSGPGPQHLLHGWRSDANCLTPATEIRQFAFGRVRVTVALLCFDARGRRMCELPCKSAAGAQASFHGRVRSHTRTGDPCRINPDRPLDQRRRPNHVEAVGAVEAKANVNNKLVFVGSASAHTGNRLSQSLSYGLTRGLHISVIDPSIRLDRSEQRTYGVSGRPGRIDRKLRLAGGREGELPITVRLTSAGEIRLTAEDDTTAQVASVAEAAMVAIAAFSDCPGVGPLAAVFVTGRRRELEGFLVEAESFFFSRLGIVVPLRAKLLSGRR